MLKKLLVTGEGWELPQKDDKVFGAFFNTNPYLVALIYIMWLGEGRFRAESLPCPCSTLHGHTHRRH